MESKRTTCIVLSVVSVLFLVSILVSYFSEKPPKIVTKEITDTLYLHDTICVPTPVYLTKKVTDTLLVEARDTIVRHDTLFVKVAREQKQYGDSYWTAWVSGYEPALDSLHYVKQYEVVERERVVKKDPRYSVGVLVGYGAGEGGLSPIFGVGLSMNIFSW